MTLLPRCFLNGRPPPAERLFSIHGGAGAIISVGLLRRMAKGNAFNTTLDCVMRKYMTVRGQNLALCVHVLHACV